MAKKLLTTLLLPLTVIAAAFAFVACGDTPDVKYHVTYVIGENAEGTAPTETDKAFGEKFKLKSADGITSEGATFAGWNDGNITYQAGAEFTMPSKAVTFTAQWQPNGTVEPTKYTVTYVLNGGTGTVPTETDKAKDEKFNLAASTGLINGTKEFDGWSDGTTKYAAGAEYTMPEKAVTFTAQWKDAGQSAVTYTVTYNLNGGSGTLPTETNKAKDEKFNLAPSTGLINGTKEFDGWSDGTTKYAAGAEYTMPEKAVTFTAQWKDKADTTTKYTVTVLKSSNASLESSVVGDVPTVENKAEGDKFTLPQNALSLPHYTLSVWRVQKFVVPQNGEGYWDTVQNYQPDAEIEMPAFNIRIAAVWTANEVTISFDANGGTGDAMTPVKQNFGTNMSLETAQKFACTYTAPAGKEFAGWAATPNGEALGNGTKLDGTIVSADDTVTLYALWETPVVPANPMDSLVGSWTNGTDTIVISEDKLNTYTQGSAILNGKYLCTVFVYEGEISISSLDYELYYDVSFTATTLTLTDDDGVEKAFTAKTAVTNSPVSDFAGNWIKAGTTQKWVITEDSVKYGVTNLADANMVIIGNYCALYFGSNYSYYYYVMTKGDNVLNGYYVAPESTPVVATFNVDESNPSGDDDDDDNNDSSNEITFTGSLKISALATYTSITINTDTLAYSYVGFQSADGTATAVAGNDRAFKIKIGGEDFWILISEDKNSLQIFDWSTMDVDEDLKATFTRQA